MQTLSTELKNTLNSATPKYTAQVLLYRNYWNGSAFEYLDPIDVTDQVQQGGIGSIQTKFDTESFEKWTNSNVNITLRNERSQWLEGNPDGYYPSSEYRLFNTKVVIKVGAELEDGTSALVYAFTGYLSDDNVTYPDDRSIQFAVLDHMTIFDQRNAEEVGTVVTNECVGSGSGTAFTTANKAVGIITSVKKGLTASGASAATELDSGTDYSVSNLNEHDLVATITLETALNSDQSVWVTYTYWYLDKKLEWIVEKLCDLCGVTNRSISPAVFYHSIKSTFSESGSAFAGTRSYLQIGYSETRWYDLATHTETTGLYLIPTEQHTYSLYPQYLLYDTFGCAGTYISPVIDAGADVTSWGQFNANYNTGVRGTAAFAWRESSDSSTWSGWTDIAVGATVPATKRYLQLRFTSTPTGDINGWPQNFPNLVSWSVAYYYSTTTIPVVNMTGMSVQDAIEALAQMCCYEIGFTAQDVFVFRPRSSSSSATETFDASKIESIDSINSGDTRVYNRVSVTFGDYKRTVDSNTQGEASPNSIDLRGIREYSISNGNFLPPDSADLAYAIAPTVYEYVKEQRRRLRVTTKMALAQELGDVVEVKLSPDDFLKLWKWGDGSVRYGSKLPNVVYYNEAYLLARLPLYDVDFRVEGIEYDDTEKKTTFDLTEVIE